MNNIQIDLDLCTKCKTCVKACFIDILRWDDLQNRPIAAYIEECVGCNACEMACAVQCITVIYGKPVHEPIYY